MEQKENRNREDIEKRRKLLPLNLLLMASLASCGFKSGNIKKSVPDESNPVPLTTPISEDLLKDNFAPRTLESNPVSINIEKKIFIPTPSLRIVDSSNPMSLSTINSEIMPNLVNVKDSSSNIRVLNDNIMLDKTCLEDLNDLFVAINKENISLYIKSGFRSISTQEIAYSQAKDKSAVAVPGTSQHHTGLAIDFTSPEVNNIVDSSANFANSKAGNWLLAHAWEYGFVLPYTNGHDGIQNEDWHYFYVGKDLAEIWKDYQMVGDTEMDLFALQRIYSDSNDNVKPLQFVEL